MAVITGLISYWALDEASGDAIDAHGSNDLTETGGTIALSGDARDFELGDTEHFEHADNDDLSTGDIDFSIVCCVNLETDATTQALVSKYIGSDLEYDLVYHSGGAVFKFQVASGPSYANAAGVQAVSSAVSVATWNLVVARHDATSNTIDISVNTVLDSAGYIFGAWDSGSAFRLGNNADSQYLDGLLKKVGFWKKKLSDAEVVWLYNAGAFRSYADIVAEAGGGGGAFPANYYQRMRG